MFTRRHITAPLTLAMLAVCYLITAAQSGAMPAPVPDDSYGYSPAPATTVIVTHGSPIWTYLAVAALAVALTLSMNALVRRSTHRPLPV